MKTLKLTILTLGILVAIFTLFSPHAFADEKKVKETKTEKAEKAAITQYEAIEFRQEITVKECDKVKIIDQNEKIIYSGNCEDKKSKVLKLTSNFLAEIDGVSYYQATR